MPMTTRPSLAARRAVLLLALALALAALLAVRGTIPNWSAPVVSAAPGEVLLAASFDGESASEFNRDWDQYTGRLSAAVGDGVLRVRVGDAPAGAYSAANLVFSDFDLTVQATAESEPIDNGFGVVFRLQDKGNTSFADDSFYLFLISSDGFYRLVRVTDGVERVLSEWIDSPVIRQGLGVTNRVRVRAVGDAFDFAINGQAVPLCVPENPEATSTYANGVCVGGALQMVLRDSAIASGRIGVGGVATLTGGPGVTVAFDNLVVLSPADAEGVAS